MRIYAEIKPAVKTVKDLDSDYQHIVDTQDMDSLLDHFGQVVIDENYGSFFVKVEDGDYSSVYACDYQYPHENDRVYEIVMIHDMSS